MQLPLQKQFEFITRINDCLRYKYLGKNEDQNLVKNLVYELWWEKSGSQFFIEHFSIPIGDEPFDLYKIIINILRETEKKKDFLGRKLPKQTRQLIIKNRKKLESGKTLWLLSLMELQECGV